MDDDTRRRRRHRRRQRLAAGAAIVLALALGALLLAGTGRHSQLIGFFAYMSVACTLVPLPTPPYVIALGRVFDPWVVALVGAIGNTIAAFAEYHLVSWIFSKTELQERVEANRTFRRFRGYFERAAFGCLVLTGFTPIPFEPFRYAAILIRYDMFKYLLAILVGRFPRYYLVALIGDQFQVPNWLLIGLLILLLVILTVSVVASERASRSTEPAR